MFRPLILAFALVLAIPAFATDYYISPSGNDANNGTSPATAWRTIARVNQGAYGYQPGDRILFERGGTWRGEVILGSSGSPGQPITVGAYGSGPKPLIKGSEQVTGWIPYQGNIWRASVQQEEVVHVYVNGQLMTPARYPNSGWLQNHQSSNNLLYSNDLDQPNGYWTGASVVLRSSNWSFDTLRVSNYANGTLQFTTNTTFLADNPWGFYMRGKLEELDSPSEWYYDRAGGQLYLWAPGGDNPNNLDVEVSAHAIGVNCYWQRSHLRIQGIAFKHQRFAGIRNDGASHVTVEDCDFQDLYHGVSAYGTNDRVAHSTFRDTYATAIYIIGNQTEVIGNQLDHIAMVVGEGESTWGYFGILASGPGVVIRGNRLDTIGYIGIAGDRDALIEKNVVYSAVALLNDGGAIALDHTDGMVVQDNVVGNPIGRMDNGVAMVPPYNENMTMGIYFGNTAIKNTTVQRNTVFGCHGAGIHVDHTMVTSGVKVKDNQLFNNAIQITMSDYSNNVGEGATPPYAVPNYDDVYSGNVMYSLNEDQLCMLQYNVHSANGVDFGTYSNNRYFHPYNELSIKVMNFMSGYPKYYTLEEWQDVRGEDAGSTRSPLRLAPFMTTAEESGNLVQNGDFTYNVSGWGGWPTNAQVTHVMDQLDNGALRAYLPNNSIYPSFSLNNPNPFPIQDQAWYRVRCSVVSNDHGRLDWRVKGVSTSGSPFATWHRTIPFSSERRDLEMYFKSDLTDQAQVQFINEWTDPMYYLDNVEVTRVQVQPLDPHQRHKLYVNDLDEQQSFQLPSGCWKDIEGNPVGGSTITLAPFSSMIVYLDDGVDCDMPAPSGHVKVKMYLGGAMRPGENLMRDDLRQQGWIPTSEPYTDKGYELSNAGAVATPSVMEADGVFGVVDWVLVELRENDAAYTTVERVAALLLRNGNVVSPSGQQLLTFGTPVTGRLVVVRHRNHLGAMDMEPVQTDGQLMDFTRWDLQAYGGAEATTMIDQRRALWPGDVNGDGKVGYNGAGNDRDEILVAIDGEEPTDVALGYSDADVNMDGQISYTGQENDRDRLLSALMGGNEITGLVESLP